MYIQETYNANHNAHYVCNILVAFILFAAFLTAFALPFASAIRINEIMYDLNGSDSGREWIEVYNDGSESLNLSAWRFYENGEKHCLNLIQGSWSLEAGGYIIIADNSTSFLADNPSYSSTLFDSSFSLLNTGESLALWNGSEYFSNTTYSSSSGAAGDGNSLQLIDSSWQACLPTPGSVNSCQSQQNQTQNETNQTQQNQTQNTTQQNQTANQANQSIPTIILTYPEEISGGESASIEIYAYNLDEATYDAKIYISDNGGVISETYSFDEAKFKSSVYYVLGAFSGNSSRKNFTIRTKEESEFTGEANISAKIRKSGTDSIYLEYSGKIKVVEAKSGSSNSSESIAKSADAGTGGNGSEEIIRLNTLATESKEDMEEAGKESGILFMSKREMIKKYLIYAFAAFLVALIIVLFKYLRI